MNLTPNFFVAPIVAIIHFSVVAIAAIFAASQADSLGQPHGHGWIVLYDILAFPLSASDRLLELLDLPDRLMLAAAFIQSVCWGLAISLLFPLRKDHHRPMT